MLSCGHTLLWALPTTLVYVNRGLGRIALPVRLNCRPEITLLRLRRKVTSVLAIRNDLENAGAIISALACL